MKNGIILIFIVLMSACSHSSNRFPDYAETVTSDTEIPIVIDIIGFRDIQGKALGVNIEKNEKWS